ncbi:carbohydrate kinase family protein [Neobacillus muris]|uniref:carbohydrate kinase family protein n=1 Tax=Neobacillus muris TaxID=2941334 RepID=UPI00203B6FAF|nr:carbohydrate kinase family protein [Neobacillus muris]
MNRQEAIIYDLIKSNLYISEQEMEERTGLSFEEIKDAITSLTAAGKIAGRAYVLPEEKKILCIGGANVDQKIQVLNHLEFGTSNPAVSRKSKGGVARNIAENLGRLGIKAALLAQFGADSEGEWLRQETKAYVNVKPSTILQGKSTGSYTAILDNEGQMTVALADMAIYDEAEDHFVEKNWHHMQNAAMILLDTNYPAHVIHKVIENCHKHHIPLCVATVSAPKTKKLPESLEGVSWFIANHQEAEALSGLKINREGDFFRAAEMILKKGAERVVITRGNQGLIYFTQTGQAGAIVAPDVMVIDVTGAGDSLIAGILYGHIKGLKTEDACKVGVACSLITIQSSETVNPELNQHALLETFQKYFSKCVSC